MSGWPSLRASASPCLWQARARSGHPSAQFAAAEWLRLHAGAHRRAGRPAPRPRSARRQRSSNRSSSCSRPTSGVSVTAHAGPRTGSRLAGAAATRKAAIGSAKPASRRGAEVGEGEQPARAGVGAGRRHDHRPGLGAAPANGRRGSASRRPPPPPAPPLRRPGRRPRPARSRCPTRAASRPAAGERSARATAAVAARPARTARSAASSCAMGQPK